jgi:Yip1 domain
MDSPVAATESPQVSEPSLNPFQRLAAIYARPARAWTGLADHVQWWFPLLIIAIVSAVVAALLHDRALVPMLTATWRDAVANGQMPAEQAAKMEAFFRSPAGLGISVVQQFIVLPIIIVLTALMIWFGVGFVLGRPLTFRLALEVACWSGLIYIPTQIAVAAVAWSRETMKGVHVGFGLLLPDSESPSRLTIWLGGVLDALGPLSIWYVAVMILGAAALSGTPSRRVAWVLGGLYLVFVVLLSALGAMVQPGAGS